MCKQYNTSNLRGSYSSSDCLLYYLYDENTPGASHVTKITCADWLITCQTAETPTTSSEAFLGRPSLTHAFLLIFLSCFEVYLANNSWNGIIWRAEPSLCDLSSSVQRNKPQAGSTQSASLWIRLVAYCLEDCTSRQFWIIIIRFTRNPSGNRRGGERYADGCQTRYFVQVR